MDKNVIFAEIEQRKEELFEIADQIFDHPEYDGEEYFASGLLTNYLEKNGFAVEKAVGGYETSFRAVYKNGEGGPKLGILCEYDALRGLGHGCGHHMQGPSALGAALAIKNAGLSIPFELIVYGTPAEETQGGKIGMLKHGCFKELDIALMMHGGPNTCTDVRCMAQNTYEVTWLGKRAHAALAPDKGRSAFDAALLSFQGIEFLREHVPDDVRMHYTILESPGPANVVPARAKAEYSVRSYFAGTLADVSARVEKIFEGAALMTDTSYEIEQGPTFLSKIPVLTLNDLLMENARLAGAVQLAPPREKTGSTDFGNVMHEVPGSCIRVAFVPEGTSSHTQEFVDAGKTEAARSCILVAAKAMAGTCLDILTTEGLLDKIQDEFARNKERDGK